MLLTWLKANVLASISLCIVLVGTTTTAAHTVRRGPRCLALARWDGGGRVRLYLSVTAGGTIVVTVSGARLPVWFRSHVQFAALDRMPRGYALILLYAPESC